MSMCRVPWWVCVLWAIALLTAGCTPADYPSEWPRPTSSLLSSKGGCPDLSGDYDGVNGKLAWLLGKNPDYEKSEPYWPEHRARVNMTDDGSRLQIEMSLNERGLETFRERSLSTGKDHPSRVRILELVREVDYECTGGWLWGLHFPQTEVQKGLQRVDLRLARDRADGLIAGARLRFEHSLGWGDSPGVSIGGWDEIRWHHWPLRPSSADQALAAAQSVTLHRYKWVNQGRSVPTRFTSFYLERICVRYEHYGVLTVPHGPELRRNRDDHSPEPARCPDGWGKFDTGEVFRTGMDLPSGSAQIFRFEWFPLSEGVGSKRQIEVQDPSRLPVLP